MNQKAFSFTAPIEKYDFGKYFYTVVYVPEKILSQLPLTEYPRLRVEAEVDGVFLNGALISDKGRWYLMVSRKVLKSINKHVGSEVEVVFRIADQNGVDMRPELTRWLKQHPEMQMAWNKLTPGKRRGLAHRINQAKTTPTLEKRLLELEELLSAF